jgi:hypothetical protein
MQHFRCYFLCRTGKIKDVIEFHSAGDATAIDFAQACFDRQSDFPGFEVWEGTRRLHQMELRPYQMTRMAS